MARQQLDALTKDPTGTLDSPALDKRIADLNKVSNQAETDAKLELNHACLRRAGLILLTFACAGICPQLGRMPLKTS